MTKFLSFLFFLILMTSSAKADSEEPCEVTVKTAEKTNTLHYYPYTKKNWTAITEVKSLDENGKEVLEYFFSHKNNGKVNAWEKIPAPTNEAEKLALLQSLRACSSNAEAVHLPHDSKHTFDFTSYGINNGPISCDKFQVTSNQIQLATVIKCVDNDCTISGRHTVKFFDHMLKIQDDGVIVSPDNDKELARISIDDKNTDRIIHSLILCGIPTREVRSSSHSNTKVDSASSVEGKVD